MYSHTHSLQNNATICPPLCPAAALGEMRIKIQDKNALWYPNSYFHIDFTFPTEVRKPWARFHLCYVCDKHPKSHSFPHGKSCWVFAGSPMGYSWFTAWKRDSCWVILRTQSLGMDPKGCFPRFHSKNCLERRSGQAEDLTCGRKHWEQGAGFFFPFLCACDISAIQAPAAAKLWKQTQKKSQICQ